MYSGLTLTRYSGRVLGAHQKLDRVARRHVTQLAGRSSGFPLIREILHFEGKNGPDAIKRKSPAVDEPWHYFNPFDEGHSELFDQIQAHYDALVRELKTGNRERAAFEAAWLAHALVDGLTPAHHYPYEEKLKELRGGLGLESRNSLKEKWLMHGDTAREKAKNNWEMWGSKGLIMTHGMFEMGVAAILAPLSFKDTMPTAAEVKRAHELGVVENFRNTAREVAVLDMYGNYYKKGWTPKLTYQVRHNLGPMIVKTVTLSWYNALVDAGLVQ
jgi:hypothetical protein